MKATMRQVRLAKPEELVFETVEKPSPAEDQVLIKIKRIGVCGSDIHAYYGKHPYISCPVVQGHEFSGVIKEVGKGVKDLSVGDKVTVMPQLTCGECYSCRHGDYHICNNLKVIGCQAPGAAADYLAVSAALVIKLPENMSFDNGAMVEPVAVGVHAVRRLGVVKGRKILVLGAGPIGNLTAQAALGLGADTVLITDVSDFRLDVASRCGIRHTVNVKKKLLEEKIEEVFGPDRADAVIECVGAQDTMESAIALARKGSDIIVVGVFAEKPTLDIGLVQDKELRLIGTLMYKELDYVTAVDLIREERVSLKPLITTHFDFDRYAEAYKYIEDNRERSMKILIDV